MSPNENHQEAEWEKPILQIWPRWISNNIPTLRFSSAEDFKVGGLQNLEWPNVERPTFRNFKITNIKIAKDELCDYFIYEFII